MARADNVLDMNCRTREDFTALASSLSDVLIQKHGGSKLFAAFVDELARALAQPLKSDEVGKVRASMATLAMDKQKGEKAGAKGPGGKPPARMVARGREDLSSFGEVLDDEKAAADFDPDEDFVRLFPRVVLGHELCPAQRTMPCSQTDAQGHSSPADVATFTLSSCNTASFH